MFKKGNSMIGAIVKDVNHGLGVVLKSEINDKSGAQFLFVRWNEALHWKEETYLCHNQRCWVNTEDVKVLTERE